MIRHIVMFRLKESPEKEKNAQELKEAIEALENIISEVKSIEIGLNINTKPAAYDLVLISDFENEEALDRYRVHPEHQKVLELIARINKEIAVVDYHF